MASKLEIPRGRPGLRIPPALLPLLKAYAIGTCSTSLPQIVSLLLNILQHRKSASDAASELQRIFGHATDPRRFPAFCAVLIGGSTLLRTALLEVFIKATPAANAGTLRRLARFLASFVAAAWGFQLLNTKPKSYSSRDTGAAGGHDINHLEAAQQSSAGRPRSRSTAERALKNVAPFTIKPPRRRVERLLSEAGLYTIPSDFLAGRTIDLTLFAFVRALDVLGSSWNSRSGNARSKTKQVWWHMDWATTFFTLSCAAIMHAWFYAPDRLPPTYNAWISKAAQLDPRVLEALRRCRRAEFVYGKETGQAELLGQVCLEEGLPYNWGDPAQTIPVREEIVDCAIALSGRPWRMGIDAKGHKPSRFYQAMSRFAQGTAGPERHAIMRFMQGWYFAALMYFPLQLVGLGARLYALPNAKRNLGRYFTELMVAVRSAARSASFLGAFIALVYYGVSLGRHRIGPKALHMVLRYRDMHNKHSGNAFRIPGFDLLFGSEIAAGRVASDACLAENLELRAAGRGMVDHARLSQEQRRREIAQMLDGGLAVNLGCWLCGLSLLAEEPRRRVEIMLFVAPRAVGAWVPRVYSRRHLWREQLTFAVSAAVILTAVQENPGKVRGFFGKVLSSIMAEPKAA